MVFHLPPVVCPNDCHSAHHCGYDGRDEPRWEWDQGSHAGIETEVPRKVQTSCTRHIQHLWCKIKYRCSYMYTYVHCKVIQHRFILNICSLVLKSPLRLAYNQVARKFACTDLHNRRYLTLNLTMQALCATNLKFWTWRGELALRLENAIIIVTTTMGGICQ